MYDQKAKFRKKSPLPCWQGYERVPGTAPGAKGSCRKSSPAKSIKGGGTRKVCLPKNKIASMSDKERKSLASSKSRAGKSGNYRRSAGTNVSGARKPGATLRDWFKKEDWRQVSNPKKKCGDK